MGKGGKGGASRCRNRSAFSLRNRKRLEVQNLLVGGCRARRFALAAQFLAGARHAIGVHRLLDTLASGETIITSVGCIGGETG